MRTASRTDQSNDMLEPSEYDRFLPDTFLVTRSLVIFSTIFDQFNR